MPFRLFSAALPVLISLLFSPVAVAKQPELTLANVYQKGMPLDEASLVHLLKVKYPTIDNTYANYQPVFLIDQMIAICEFEGIPYQMTPELVDRAWANMFVKDEVIVK